MRAQHAMVLALGLAVAAGLGATPPARASDQEQHHGHAMAPQESGAAPPSRAQAPSMTFPVNSLSQSGIAGTVRLTPINGDKVAIDVAVNGAGSEPRPIHIHEGACADLNPIPETPLATVVNGASTTEVEAPLQQLVATPHAIFLHKSTVELPIFVACADIAVSSQMAAIPSAGEGDVDVRAVAGLLAISGALIAAGHVLRRYGHLPIRSRAE